MMSSREPTNQNNQQLSFGDYELPEVSVRLVLKETSFLYSSIPLQTPEAAVRVMGDLLRGLDREMFCVINLDNKLRAINYNVVSIGDISSSIVPVGNTFKSALLTANAACIAALHSHPSGDATPSPEDYEATKRLIQAGKLFSIPVVDHIIIGAYQGEMFSFRENHPDMFYAEPDLSIFPEIDPETGWCIAEKKGSYRADYEKRGDQMAEEARNKYQEWEQKRKEKLEEISGRIEEGMARIMDSEEFKNYLSVMASFHHYSFRNSLLIYMQKPDAQLCASYTDWQRKYRRQVNKGEKGIQILAPAPYKMKREREKLDAATGKVILGKDGKPETVEEEITVPRFKVVSTFDVSQTSGAPLPELGIKELTAEVEYYELFMEAIKRISPVPIRFDDIEGGAKGYYDSGKKEIVIQKEMPQEQTMKTAIHELTHSLLHDSDTLKLNGEELKKDRMTIEIEAEGCAFVALTHFGIEDVGDYSFPYMASWSSGRDMKELHTALSAIQQTSSEIIKGIETGMRQQMLEQDVESKDIRETPSVPGIEKDKQTNQRTVSIPAEKIADQLPQPGRRESLLKSLREKQQRVNAEFGFGPKGQKLERKGEQVL